MFSIRHVPDGLVGSISFRHDTRIEYSFAPTQTCQFYSCVSYNMPDIFDQLSQVSSEDSPLAAAKLLAEEMRKSGRYLELFEALKMQRRLELGLSAVAIESDEPPTPEQAEFLERGILDACREVGLGLLKQGRLQDGWLYMRPVADNAAVAEAIADLEVNSENIDAFLGILVHEGVDIARGVRLSAEHRGTCATITMLEEAVGSKSRSEQQLAVGQLVRHLHQELLESVQADIERREGKIPEGATLQEILSTRPTLLREGAYHIDTTHIAATVRLARLLDNKEELRLAQDLCRYGRQLSQNYQYPSEEPFGDLYLMTSYFVATLLGENVEAGLHQFLQKAESLSIEEHGTIPIETYVDLLSRIGRPKEAMAFLMKRMPPGQRPFGIAPSLIELACQARDFGPMMEQSKGKNDVVGYAAALLQSKSI